MHKIFAQFRNHNVQLVLVGALSAGAGAAGSYFSVKNRLRVHYEEIANREIAQAKEHYRLLHKSDDNASSPEKLLQSIHGSDTDALLTALSGTETAGAAFKSYTGIKVETPVATEADLIDNPQSDDLEEKVVQEVRNVFAENEVPAFDYDSEVAQRSEFEPYIITEEEYLQNEMDYEQASLTYYDGDGVLSDDEDIPVPDSDALIGDDHLVRFGHGSKSENVVFVRNDRLEMEFEIERSFGSYAQEVAGFGEEDEIKHSDSRGNRKFRSYDD